MANKITIEIQVDDKGSASIKSFSDNAAKELGIVQKSGEAMGTSFNKNWQGMATGLNQGLQLFQQLGGMALNMTKQLIDASLQMERITSTLKAVTGTSSGAAVAFAYVKDEASRLGLNLEQTALAYAKFAASTKNTTLEGEGARKVFSGVSEAVTALKLPGDAANGIFLALSQMMSKGKISAEELSGQLGERLPGAVKLTADAMGLTTQELLKQMQEGKLMSADVLPKLAEQLHKTYGAAAMEAAGQGQAAFNRMSNALFETKAVIGDVLLPVFNLLAGGITKITSYVTAFIGGLKMTAVEVFGLVDKAAAIKTALFSGALFGQEGRDKLKADIAVINETIKQSKEDIYKDIDKIATAQQKSAQHQIEAQNAAAANVKLKTQEISAEQQKAIEQITEAMRKSQIEINSYSQNVFEQEMIRIESEKKEWQKKGVSKVLISEWELKEIEKAEQKFQDQQVKNMKESLKQMDAREKSIQKGAKETATEVDKINKEATRKAEKLAEERLQAERDVYKDMRQYAGDYYQSSLRLIETQAAKYRALGIDQAAIAAWVAEETRKAEIKKLEAGGSFVDGMRAYYLRLQAEQITWAQTGLATMQAMSSGMATSFSTLFEDIYQRKLQSAGDYAGAIWDTTRKKFFEMISQMAAQKIMLFFESSWTSAGAKVIDIVGGIINLVSGTTTPAVGSGGLNVGGGSLPTYAAYGGFVPGYASGGDSLANDRVHMMLSPGEYVVPRSIMQGIAAKGRGGDTMLAHINPYEAALLKSIGGSGTINPYTGLPEFGFFSKIANIFTGGLYGAVTGDWGGTRSVFSLLNPGVVSARNALTADSWQDVIDAVFDPITGPGITQILGTVGGKVNQIAPWVGEVINTVAPMIGALVASYYGGPALGGYGYAAGQGFASKWNKEKNETAVTRAAITAAATYAANTGAQLTDNKFSQEVIKRLINVAAKAATAQLMPPEVANAKLSIAYRGYNDGGAMDMLNSYLISQAPRQYAFSARKGLEFVPYDNFPLNAHYGERLETKEEAERSRRGENGRSVVINFNIGGNIIGDKQAFNDFAEKIDFIINKRNKRVYAAA